LGSAKCASESEDFERGGIDQQAAINRTLKGEKLADLPVQAPTQYDLVINPTLGLAVLPTLLAGRTR
jgi:hypothetical protein